MSNLFRRDFSGGWYPSADANNAPPGVMLRGDNLVLDDEGIVTERQGSANVNSQALGDLLSLGLGSNAIHSLHTAVIGGTRYRYIGVGNNVVGSTVSGLFELNGNMDSPLAFTGSGDIAMADGFGHVFFARGTTKKKRGTSTATNWGIVAPDLAPVVRAKDPVSKNFATCDQTESPAFVANEGAITASYPTGADDTANGAIELTPAATGRATITKTFATDQDFSEIDGHGDPRDLFDMLAWVTEPEKQEKTTIMVGLGTGTDPFQNDYYYFDFDFDPTTTSATGVAAPTNVTLSDDTVNSGVQTDTTNNTEALAPPDVTSGQPGTIIEFEGGLGDNDPVHGSAALVSTARRDAAYNPGWTHYSCLRGQFKRVGNTEDRNWQTVRAVKVVYKATAGATGVVRFDTIRMQGGALSGALTGEFRFRYRAVKHYTTFVEMSPLSPPTDKITFVGQKPQITIPLSTLQGLDAQADQIWVYFFGGILDRWYRCATSVIGGNSTAFRIDEFAKTPDSSIGATDRARFTGFGFSVPAGTVGVTAALVLDVTTNEIEAQIINESFDDRESKTPDNIIGIAADYYERFFVLSQASGEDGYVYISERRRPGIYKFSNVLRIGNGSEPLYWIKKTTGGLYIGSARDIYSLTGTADELEDGTLDLTLTALNIGSPPVDACIASEGNALIYRASDGMRTFDGIKSEPVPREAVELLHRGYTRHGVSPLNLTTGRFRAALSRGVLTMLAPEGSATTSTRTLYRADFNRGKWYRATYPPSATSFTVLHREPDGTVLAGDDTGYFATLDTGTTDYAISGGLPTTTSISPVYWTKVDDDALPLSKKDLFDLSLEMDTGNTAATVAIHLDGSGSVATNGNLSVTCNGRAFYKRTISDIASCRAIQLRISGALPSFKLYSFNIAYRGRPQQRMYVDTGYVRIDRQDVTWMRTARVMMTSPANVTVTPYFDDTAGTAYTLAVTANKVKVYEIPMGRQEEGGAPRITFATVSSPATTEPLGMEVYWVEFFYTPSGNETQKKSLRLYGDQL